MDSFVHRNQFSFTLLLINWRIAILKVSIKMEDGGIFPLHPRSTNRFCTHKSTLFIKEW